jgi:hypothetical protein
MATQRTPEGNVGDSVSQEIDSCDPDSSTQVEALGNPWIPVFHTAILEACDKHGLHYSLLTHEGYMIAVDEVDGEFVVDTMETVTLNMKRAVLAGQQMGANQSLYQTGISEHRNTTVEYTPGGYL